MKGFGSNKEVTLTWGKEINFRIKGNFKPLVEKYQKVKKAIDRLDIEQNPDEKAVKTSLKTIEKIIGNITLGTIHNQHWSKGKGGGIQKLE